jgi:beta-lactamase class A
MVEAFRRFEEGTLSPEAVHVLKEEEKMPSCGALNRMHAGLEVSMLDLVDLMIVLSDNTATNILIDILGIENVNATMRAEGLAKSTLRRKLFDAAGHAAGIENHVTALEMGMLLEKMYRGELISEAASAKMIEILKNQKLNGKMPFFLKPMGIASAHKTGEDTGITHDVGIVFARKPFVLCMLSNETEVPVYERLIQDIARDLAVLNG